MSPEMLTLVAAVLTYERALETCDRLSLSLYVRSETKEENDMFEVTARPAEQLVPWLKWARQFNTLELPFVGGRGVRLMQLF